MLEKTLAAIVGTLEWILTLVTISSLVGIIIYGRVKYPLESWLYVISKKAQIERRKEQKYQQWKAFEDAQQRRIHEKKSFRKRYEREKEIRSEKK